MQKYMIRKLSLILVVLFPFVVKSQQMTGSWEVYNVYNSVDNVLETPDKLYYTSSGSLYYYDVANNESVTMNIQNGLNDTDILNIYYNAAQKYLLVAYSGGNIDLIYDNGDIVNMSDIKDAVMSTEKIINNVIFSGDNIYVSTNFGVVMFDGKKHYVIQSGIYGTSIDFFTQVGDYLIIKKSDGNLYYMSATGKINVIDNFKPLYTDDAKTNKASYSLYKNGFVLSDNTMIGCTSSNTNAVKIRKYTFDFVNEMCTEVVYTHTQYGTNTVKSWNGGYYVTDGTYLLLIDKEGNKISENTLQTAITGQKIAFWKSSDIVWACDANGLARYDLSGENITVLNEKFKPGNLSIFSIDYLRPDFEGNIYMTVRCADFMFPHPDQFKSITKVNRINVDGTIEDITSTDFTYYFNSPSMHPTTSLSSNTSICPHPSKKGVYYVPNFFEGIMKFQDNHHLYSYNNTNSAIPKPWGSYAADATFDSKGNMWVMGFDNNTILCLPADKVDNETTTVDDWKNLRSFSRNHDGMIIACKKSNFVLLISGIQENSPIHFYNTKGTDSFDDDEYKGISTFIDQDGKQFSVYQMHYLLETSNGKVWVATDDGVFEIPNVEDAFKTGKVVRIKVPRNDGTNLADYLLAGQYVLGIDEDSSGRKWITTRDSGVYLVSNDGTEILQHFTKDNSVFTTNNIHCVACSKVSNAVYFGAEGMLYKYNATAAPAAEDYSEVIAYPNPVRPDYSGWITIKGLMNNSLVKIADAAGNVVFQTTSEGGMAIWNGCNLSGERVRTGVYYVFASQSGDGISTSAAVTKILVVK